MRTYAGDVPFKDRKHAGISLTQCPKLHGLQDPVVVALPRGAVVVAVEVAAYLKAPLTVMPVEEIATPGKPEYIVGAVAENAIRVIDAEALAALGVTEDSIAVRVAEATARIARLSKLYRGEERHTAVTAGRPVVVVDDGSATVPALEAVALAMARHNVASVWLLTPTIPPGEIHGYDRVAGPEHSPQDVEDIALVGTWYDEPSAPSDEVAAEIVREFNVVRQAG